MDIEFNPQSSPDIYIKSMTSLQSLFHANGFSLCLNGGTLLGTIRDNDFISGDDDVDMFYISKRNDLKSVLQEFETVIKPFLIANQYEIIPISWTWNQKKHPMLGQCHIIKDGVSIDLWSGWFSDENRFYLTYAIEGTLNKNDILPLKGYNLKESTFYIPNHYDEFLQVLYGKDWKIPDPNYKTKCNPNFLQKKVLKIIDQYGWAYFFIAKDQQKYSIHNIDFKKVEELSSIEISDITSDIIYLHSPGLGISKIESFINKIKYSGLSKKLK